MFDRKEQQRVCVLVADDHLAVAEGLCAVLEPEFDVIATVSDGNALVAAATTLTPDVIVTDIAMPGLDGIAAASEILQKHPMARIVFVTVHNDAELVQKGLAIGALGYVLKLTAGEDLIPAIHAALRGIQHVSPLIGRRKMQGVTSERSDRQKGWSACTLPQPGALRVGIPRGARFPGGAWAREQEVACRRAVMLAVGRETCSCSVVSSTRGGRIMAERRSLTFGPFRLDLLQSRLWRETQPIAIRPQALTVLRYLVLHADQLVTKAELFQHVWDGRHVTDTVLRGCIHAIRVALADTAATPQYLETVGRLGYRFRLGRVALRLRPADTRPIVGRQEEVEWLQERYMWAMEGQRQFSVISGEVGIGKTTVVDLFVASLPTQRELAVGRGQCVETYGDGEPYLPMLEALGQLGRSTHWETLLTMLQRYAPTWLVQLPGLLGDSERERLKSQLQGVTPARMLRELAEALEAFTTAIPLVLVLENLHWSDVSTVNLLTYLAQRREAARFLLLGTYRPVDVVVLEHPLRGVLQELRGRGLCEELLLELLLPEDVGAYATARLDGEVTAALTTLLYRHSEGNALFMVNLLEHLVEQGMVHQEGDQWMIRDSGTAGTSLPDALQLLITKRLEMLSRDAQCVLEVASMVGDMFATAAVAAGLDVPVEEVNAICDTLAQQHAFLEPAGLAEWPDGTLSGCYQFQHALYRQVLAARLGELQRVQVHRRIGERLVQAYGLQTPTIATQQAFHFVHGRLPPRAMPSLHKDGE